MNWCCLRGKLSEPITIAPGAVGEVPAEVSVNEYAKTFSHEVELFLNDGRWLRQPKVGVKGTTDPATVKPLPPEPAAPTPTPPAPTPTAPATKPETTPAK